MNNKTIFFTYKRNEQGEISLNRVCAYNADSRKIDAETFDMEKHAELFKQFLSANNIEGESLVSELGEKGLFNEKDITREKLEKYVTSENRFIVEETNIENEEVTEEENPVETSEFHAEDEYVETNDEKDHTVAKRVFAGVLAAGTVVGALTLLHSCDQDLIDESTKDQTLEDLLNQMTPEQKAFFESSFKAVDTFNNNTIKEGNFALEQDESKLHMSVDEGIALNIIMNNYSSEDLYDIFGTVEFDTTNLMNLARSAYGKLSTYYMNAKEASGLSQLINDEAARAFFESHENVVIEFNNNPSVELADKVIKGMYKDYTYNGSNGEYAKINNDGVAWFATTPAFGYELANRNVPEFLKTKDGLSLNQVTSNELLTGINEEINLDIMDELDNKSLCASVTSQTKDKIDALTMKQNIASTIIETNAKDELIEGLRENGNISLANKVLASDITPELLKEISASSSKNNELVDEYKSRINSLEAKETKIMAVLNLAQEKYNSKEELDIAGLVNNRFRSKLVLEKDNTAGTKEEQLKEDLYVGVDKNGNNVYDGDKLNKLPQEEKDKFIKDNGTVVDKTTEVVKKEEVKFEDLTPEEQQQVVDIEAVLREIETLRNNLIEQGVNDAIRYTESSGVYNYNGTIINPYNNEKIDTNGMSLFNIVAYDAAFGNAGVSANATPSNANVAAVRAELNSLSSDARNYLKDKYGSNWAEEFIQESYVYGYSAQVQGSLAQARQLGAQIRKDAEEAYKKAQAEVDKKNNIDDGTQTTQTPNTTIPSNPVDTNPNYDPNLDPNYGMEDEIPYVPSFTIETPGIYDADLETAFNEVFSEGNASKAK